MSQVYEGVLLLYTKRCSPTLRVFETMDALERFVGREAIANGRSDDDWVDAVIQGKFNLVDDAINVEFDDELAEAPKTRKCGGACEYACTEECYK